jgi:hypothetical protein
MLPPPKGGGFGVTDSSPVPSEARLKSSGPRPAKDPMSHTHAHGLRLLSTRPRVRGSTPSVGSGFRGHVETNDHVPADLKLTPRPGHGGNLLSPANEEER